MVVAFSRRGMTPAAVQALIDTETAGDVAAAVAAAVAADVTGGSGWAVFAASDAPTLWKTAARVSGGIIADGTADNVDFNTLVATGRNILLSPGRFVGADAFGGDGSTFVSGQQIEGSGYTTLLDVPVSGGAVGHVLNIAGASDGSRKVGIAVRNLRIRGYGDDAGVTQKHGLRFKFCSKGIVENIWASDVTFSSVLLSDCDGFTGGNLVTFRESSIRGTNGGWYGPTIENTGSADKSAGHVLTGIYSDVIEHAWAITESDDNTINGATARNCRNDYAFNITNADRNIAKALHAIGCHGYLFIEQGSTGNLVDGLIGKAAGAAHGQNGIFVSASPENTVKNYDIDLAGQTSGNGVRADGTSDGFKSIGGKVWNAVTRGVYFENGLDYGVCESTEVHDTTGGPGFQFGTGIGLRASDLLSEGNSAEGYVLACVRGTLARLHAIGNTGDGFEHQFMDDTILDGVALSNGGYGFDAGAAASNSERNRISGKAAVPSFLNTAGAVRASTATGAAANRYDVDGYTLANRGTSAIPSAATSVDVTHGLSVTPTIDQISVVFGENPTNDPGIAWISNIGASTFRVNVRADPGASNLDFGWKVAP